MADINDKSFRQTLIERFLNCDTTVAEERELARFYAECLKTGCVPVDEKSVCALITTTVATTASDDCTKAYEPIVGSRTLRHLHWRWVAAACVAAIIAVGAVVKFAAYDNESTMRTTSNITAKVQKVQDVDETPKTHNNTIPDATKTDDEDESYNQRVALSPARMVLCQSDSPQPVKSKADVANSDTPSAIDMNNVCNVAVAAFCDASSITIERKGDVVLLTTADGDGTCCRYVVGEASDGQMTLAAL